MENKDLMEIQADKGAYGCHTGQQLADADVDFKPAYEGVVTGAFCHSLVEVCV